MRIEYGLVIGLITTFLCTSCSHSSKSSSTALSTDSMTVDIKDVPERNIPQILEKSEDNLFGPAPTEPIPQSTTSKKGTVKVPRALLISAGLYRAVSAVSLLRELKVIDRVPAVLMGHGLSAVVAAYFAFGFEPDFIEWKFFQFVEKAKMIPPFSVEWSELFEKILLKEISSKQIEEAKLTLLLPVWNRDQRKVVYLKRGPLKAALMANIDYYGNQKTGLGPAMLYNFASTKLLRDLGVKEIFALDLLSTGISWKNGNGLLNGFFQKAGSIMLEEKGSFDVVIDYPISDFELDDSERLADLVFQSKKLAKKYLSKFTKEEEL